MKREDKSSNSAFSNKPPTRKSHEKFAISSPYDESFTEIPREVEESYNDFVITRSQPKTELFFEPAQSQAEYGRILHSSQIKSKEKLKLKTVQDYNYKVWNFFTNLNKGSSDNQEESEEKSNTFSFKSRRTSDNDRNDQLDVAIIQEERDQREREKPSFSNSKTTQEINKKERTFKMKIQTMKTASKEVDITIQPSSNKNPRSNVRKTFKRIFNISPLHIQEGFGLFDSKVERIFVKLQQPNLSPQRESPHISRTTRMKPLRYWLGERIVYGKDGAKGKIVVKE